MSVRREREREHLLIIDSKICLFRLFGIVESERRIEEWDLGVIKKESGKSNEQHTYSLPLSLGYHLSLPLCVCVCVLLVN